MVDFRLPDETWGAACREIKAAAGVDLNDGHRLLIEFYCGLYIAPHHPQPAKYRDAWLAFAKAADDLRTAADHLRDVGAAELEFIGLFQGGDDIAMFIREQLPQLSEMARVVAEIEAQGPRLPAKADPARDALARQLVGFWAEHVGKAGATESGPLTRFLVATLGETMRAAGQDVPTPKALRALIRKARGELTARTKSQ
jgi:hypothetical protein